MPDLRFRVEGAEAVRHAATPQLVLRLAIANTPEDEAIHSALLRCQVRIDAPSRHYERGDHAGLRDLFGAPERWSRTLTSVLWAQATTVAQGFAGEGRAELALPCTWDFNAAWAKYFHALAGGVVPLTLLFSGTVFYQGDSGLLAWQVPRTAEAAYELPVGVWREAMEHYHPNAAVLPLRRDVFDRLDRYRVDNGLTTWEQALARLLDAAGEGAAR